MLDNDLWTAIEAARKRLKLSKPQYAERVGISRQTLYLIKQRGGASGATLARLKRNGDVRGLGQLIGGMDGAA